MCGIAGVVGARDGAPWTGPLQSALGRLANRGPDDAGFTQLPGVLLGHRRLAILDLSAGGHQPMTVGRLTVVFNGEIYNYRELRRDLESRGVAFRSDSDTEVLLQAWSFWGEDAVSRFIGMWAFAIVDTASRQVFLSRDPFGIKPLYFAHRGGVILFASEIPALLEMGCPAQLNLSRAVDYLVTAATDHTDETFFGGVRQLSAGHNLTIDLATGGTRLRRFYSLPGSRQPAAVADFAVTLERSVEMHLRSDVPVGTCLSGGLDSSAVAALAARSLATSAPGSRFAAVTSRVDEPGLDETAFAGKVVDRWGLDWHITCPQYADFREHIGACLDVQGEPVGGPSVFMQYWVMKKAHEVGLKVMLDGQGGDETLLGYERYYVAYFLDLLRRGHLTQLVNEFRLSARHSRLSLARLSAFVAYFGVPAVRRRHARRRSSFLGDEAWKRVESTVDEMSSGYFSIDRLQRLEIERYCLPHLLRYEDRNSMAWSIEARVPFVSPPVVETALALPAEEKIKNGFTKHALRVVASGILPEEVAWRRGKLGFEAPVTNWMREHANVARETVSGSPLIRRLAEGELAYDRVNVEMQWRLFNLAHWGDRFGVSL